MLTIEQCRAARGLLGWTQQDLADSSGLSKTAINNFEKGHSDIKAESLRAIRIAFERAEIEFQGDSGLRKRSEQTRILKGPKALGILLDDIRKTMENQKNDILIMNADTTLSSKITSQKLFDHIQFLKQNEIRQRVLCAENIKNVLSPDDECRWLGPEIPAHSKLTFIYGTKVAIQLWNESMIVLIDSTDAVVSETARFEHLWEEASPASGETPFQQKTA
ncbi:MAG: helix-turn-helix transcriptional regulator [Alphaproteobacteria bacterium]|nr:helix-turn-helix transcriptional regulator [Alphaproteobacteria bacterium]